MLYNYEKNLRTTEERVRSSNTSEANKQVIFEYESYCFAEDLKVVRVIKHLMELKVLAEVFGKDFSKASKQDVIKLVGAIERMDRSEATKRDYKNESGARISELGNLKIKHVKFDQYGAVLMVDGKTGMRRVRIIFSSPYLATWLVNHPFRDNPEAFVWVRDRHRRQKCTHAIWCYQDAS
ncbi:MAG: hypothetical protein FIB07_06490 [Candidatus Methanoperedens sp.]|nr:hypothetical protein [Candidatus Methanoperedens sp.]